MIENFISTILPPAGLPALSPERELELQRDPELRVADDRELQNDIFLCSQSNHPHYAASLNKQLRRKRLELMRVDDPFRRNLPFKGDLPSLTARRAPLVYLPNQSVLSLPLGLKGTARHIIMVGPIGAGKTNCLKVLALSFSGRRALIVIIDRKGDLQCLADYEQDGEVIVLNAYRDVRLSLAEGLDFQPLEHHIAQKVANLTFHLQLHAARRLLTTLCHELLKTAGPKKLNITNLIQLLESIPAARTSKLGGYRDDLLFRLKDLVNRSGPIFDATQSNFLERMTARPGTYVINCGGMASSHISLMTAEIISYLYEKRRVSGDKDLPALIAVDDALPFVTASRQQEAEGRSSPLANWITLSRSLNIGLCLAAQNFSLLSPTIRNNTHTVIAVGANYGEDASALARFMNLDADQQKALTRLRLGEAIAISRDQWPLAVKGVVPEVV